MSFTPKASVSFRHMEHSNELVKIAEQELQTLCRRHPQILSGDVVIEKTQTRHRVANPMKVRLSLGLPGKMIISTKIGEDPDEKVGACAALFQAFHAAEHAVAVYKTRMEVRRHGDEWAAFMTCSDHGGMS